MAIHKGQAARTAVIASWKVNHLPLRRLIWPAVHARAPLTIIDAIAPFIQEYDRHRRTRIYNLPHFLVFDPASASQASVVGVGAIKPTEHRDHPHAGNTLTLEGS